MGEEMRVTGAIGRGGVRVAVESDGRTVWVNGSLGLLGRFGNAGIDIHQPLSEQMEEGECLFCTHAYTGPADWVVFKEKMAEHFGVQVGDEHMPVRFKETP